MLSTIKVMFFCDDPAGPDDSKILDLYSDQIPRRDDYVFVWDRDQSMYVKNVCWDYCEEGPVPKHDVMVEVKLGHPPHMYESGDL